MIDLHTHLLPDWDDGARDWEETAGMARIAQKDGITKICLTPHLYRLTKYGDNIELLEEGFAKFKHWASGSPIQYFRGVEVYVDDQIVDKIKKHKLTVNNSCYVFVEFPADSVMAGVRDLFYRIMLEGYIPIISHPERNVVFARTPELLFDVVKMGALAQVTANSILGDFGHEARQAAEVFLKHNLVHLIASDSHDAEKRPPQLKRAVDKAKKIVGKEKALAMVTEVPQAILDNQEIPDYGEARNPQKKKWAFRLT